ncbi:MAG: serine hydrolase [Calditrichaceae bacterium]|nr:serine hydrolase [Calditrichaceae bacterium]
MFKHLFYISMSLFIILQSCTPSIDSKIDDLVKMYSNKDYFSGVVLYAKDGKIVYNKAFGLSNHEESINNTIETRFNIGSLNKDFTYVLILQLLSEDSLKLDDPIGQYIDDFDDNISKKVTIRHILRHASGFGDYGMHPEYQKNRTKFKTVDDLLKLIVSEPLLFKPGSNRYYSNSGFIVLGKIIENITNKPYADVLQQRIFDPLDMKNTYYSHLDTLTNRATGYIKSATGKLIKTIQFENYATPAGGCYSTTGDLYKFYSALENTDILLTDPHKKIMYVYANPDIKLTWEKIISDESIFNAKAGGFEGFNAMVVEWMVKGEIAIILANYDEPVAEEVGNGVFAIMRNLKPEKPRLPIKQYVYNLLNKDGYDYMSMHFDSLMKSQNYQYEDPWLLNQVGYDLLHENLFEEAIQIFKLNVKRYPKLANPYDSLGEAYMKAGENELAVENYSKSLELDPTNQNAINIIAKLMEKQ